MLTPSFPPADALLTAVRRVDWRGVAHRYFDAVETVCVVLAAVCVVLARKWQHHRIGVRLATAAAIGAAFLAIGAAFLAIGAAWLWESGRPAAIRWIRETAWPVARLWAAETALAIRAIAQPPLTV